MTRVAVMQPYLFPYVGYLQLMRSVDVFVSLDDVQFVKHRWMNRNRILLGGSARWLTLPVRSAPLGTTIRAKRYDLGAGALARFGEVLREAYGRRPGWQRVEVLLDDLAAAPGDSVAEVNEALLLRTLELLGSPPPRLLRSSELGVGGMEPQQRVIDLVRAVGGDEYLNPPGGRELYSARAFAAAGVALSFLEPVLQAYPQGPGEFVPGLSVVDLIANEADGALGTGTVVPAE